MQCYIIGLVLGLSLKDIYELFIKYIRKYYKGSYLSSREHIYNFEKSTPNHDVEKIIDEIFDSIEIDPQIRFIRKRWDILKKPDINIDGLVELIDEKIPEKLGWEMKIFIKKTMNTETKKRLTIDKFANMFYNKFKKPKALLKKDEIRNSLKYNLT